MSGYYDIHVRVDIDIEGIGRIYQEAKIDTYTDSHKRTIDIIQACTEEAIKVIKKSQTGGEG